MGHRMIQSTGYAMTGVRSSLVPHAVLLMPLRAEKFILIAQQYWQTAICESKPGHLWSSTYVLDSYFWVMHECSFHVQTKVDLSLCG